MAKDESAAVVAMTSEQFREFISGMRGQTDEQMKKQAEYDAQAMRQALRPENEHCPDVLAKAEWPDLACPVMLYGFPVSKDLYQVSADGLKEWNLLCEASRTLKPGDYFMPDTSGRAKIKVTVSGEYDPLGKPRKLTVTTDIRGQRKWAVPPVDILLQSLLDQHALGGCG